jgi:pimeloyl-ACP methyl ester carboxylesterase
MIAVYPQRTALARYNRHLARRKRNAMTRILRKLWDTGAGWLHVRELGSGPTVVLLHQSPQHGGSLEMLQRRLSAHCRVLVPDMPGYGLSTAPSPANVELADIARILSNWLAAENASGITVFGVHSGAIVALELMQQAKPGSVAKLYLDGIPLFGKDEQSLFDQRYFPRYVPEADGSHLMNLWNRLRDQYRYFPWYKRGNPNPRPEPDTATIQAAFFEVMQSEFRCWDCYQAVLRFDSINERLQRWQDHICAIYRDQDVLGAHRVRFEALNVRSELVQVADVAALHQFLEQRLG